LSKTHKDKKISHDEREAKKIAKKNANKYRKWRLQELENEEGEEELKWLKA